MPLFFYNKYLIFLKLYKIGKSVNIKQKNKTEEDGVMVHPLFLLGIIAAKLYVLFKAGQKQSMDKMKEAAEKELRELNVPKDFAEDIISGVQERMKKEEATPEEFIKALKEVFDEMSEGAKRKFDSALNSFADMTKEARKGFADLLRKVADGLGEREK